VGKKLYVGNLPFAATESSLSELFAQAGAVESVRVITDRDSGRSKGFGFVEMASDEDAQNAISSFNGTDVGGRQIVVNEARPMQRRDGGGGGFESGGGGGGWRGGSSNGWDDSRSRHQD
jgi:RNA recognition motif-containing protein